MTPNLLLPVYVSVSPAEHDGICEKRITPHIILFFNLVRFWVETASFKNEIQTDVNRAVSQFDLILQQAIPSYSIFASLLAD